MAYDINKTLEKMEQANERARRALSEQRAELAKIRNGIERDADIARTNAKLQGGK